MRQGYIVHPDMLTNLADFYASSCTIQQATVTQNAVKEDIDAWANLHVGLACAVAPPSSGGRGEVKLSDQTYVVATHMVDLAGYYPTVTERMRVLVNGLVLDILLVVHDSHQKTTRLTCEVVT